MNTTRRHFLKSTTFSAATLVCAGSFLSRCTRSTRPNILWILAEDLCPDLGCYGNPHVRTPNIDRLADEGIRFTNAFTTAPVCSASRSAFGTGMYQTSIDAHNHRSHRQDNYVLPEGVKLISHRLREAGYFTANATEPAPGIKCSGKTDFNFNAEKPFDGTDWNQREKDQPFYTQINFAETHRKFKRSLDYPTPADKIDIPPYYPDHPITREDWAAYYDTINVLDQKVGAVLKRLEAEQLLNSTVIFFFSDHGRPHVRGKQWLYEGGIHIPLIIRWPERLEQGSIDKKLISAIDITATTLDIAGVKIPERMQGRIFLGPRADHRDYIVAARDRCDETVDRIRCIRSSRFKYIRNFYPNRPYLQLNRYKETEYPVVRLLRRMSLRGELTPEQELFMARKRPDEELYDLEKDPFELNNLAGTDEYLRELAEYRTLLDKWIEGTGDMGEIPEDPSIPLYYKNLMKEIYDERLSALYKEEGMSLSILNQWL